MAAAARVCHTLVVISNRLFLLLTFLLLAGCLADEATLAVVPDQQVAAGEALSIVEATATVPQAIVKAATPTAAVNELGTIWVDVLPSPTSNAPNSDQLAEISASTVEDLDPVRNREIGKSALGRPIEVWQFGSGPNHIVLVGGIHGGYEWNTIELAYQFVDYFLEQAGALPENVTVSVVPSANPDGQVAVVGDFGRIDHSKIAANTVPGRFNSNKVDLNRNWDCGWRSDAVWQTIAVSGGSAPFSEPESVVMRDFIVGLSPYAVIFYHSAADGVYTGQCDGARHHLTDSYAQLYADEAGYPINTAFSAYSITGDASDYLNKVDIPSFTVELTNHLDTEFGRNIKAVMSLIETISVEGGR